VRGGKNARYTARNGEEDDEQTLLQGGRWEVCGRPRVGPTKIPARRNQRLKGLNQLTLKSAFEVFPECPPKGREGKKPHCVIDK